MKWLLKILRFIEALANTILPEVFGFFAFVIFVVGTALARILDNGQVIRSWFIAALLWLWFVQSGGFPCP